MLASFLDKPKTVKLLLDSFADVTTKDICGETAIHHASKEGSVEVIQHLILTSKVTNEESGLGLNPLDCTMHKLLCPLGEHRHTESSKVDLDISVFKSYQLFCSKQAPTERNIAKTEEVVHVAEKLTELAARSVQKKAVKRMGKRSYAYNSESESDSNNKEEIGCDTDEFAPSGQMTHIDLTPKIKYLLPKWGQMDIDMTDVQQEDAKKKDKKKPPSSSESGEKKKKKSTFYKKKRKEESSESPGEKKKTSTRKKITYSSSEEKKKEKKDPKKKRRDSTESS
jgi:hypothetical protein